MPRYLAKQNQDSSFSVSFPAGDLADCAFVDYYDDTTGKGFQRWETLTPKRGRDVAAYVARCVQNQLPWRLFEMTANARIPGVTFDPLDEDARVGFLEIPATEEHWLSMIDGGTRLLGIKNALAEGTIDRTHVFDVRVFRELTAAEEIALFLLINETQKKVRTDLGLRVVQRALDEGRLTDDESKVLQSVVPDTDSWRFEASRMAARLNTDPDSPWRTLIQMPGDRVTRPIKLQAFFTSLRPILTDGDIRSALTARAARGDLMVSSQSVGVADYLLKVLKNFWAAVAEECPDAHQEPSTTVLWGSIGAASSHIALSRIIATVLANEDEPDLTKARFAVMIGESVAIDHAFWFSRPGSQKAEYPGEKGEATKMTGASNYSRLARQLEREWRAALHSAKKAAAAIA
ncbi:MAG: DGQHR domain-containing protein [Dehalococcoidia bacterium]